MITPQPSTPSIIPFVSTLLNEAINAQASDIHLEPYAECLRIRYRVDGRLYDLPNTTQDLIEPVISRIKVLAGLNITESRVPQDGRFCWEAAHERTVDIRVSTLPTTFGESLVLRILDKSASNLKLEALGMPPHVYNRVQHTVESKQGLFITTGPTGCGKTTTLYSALKTINDPNRKILTVEDPIEYALDGTLQTSTNEAIGLDFATTLRAFLRQDPDVLLVGEIRDLETAQIALQASLTGHLVLSSLHTKDAPSAATRLIDLGLEPYLVAAGLQYVLGQRLLRRVCLHCKEYYQPTDLMLEVTQIPRSAISQEGFCRGTKCSMCNFKGYNGRIALFESMPITDTLREKITQGASTLELKAQAQEEGMRTLRNEAINALLKHQTSIEEFIEHI